MDAAHYRGWVQEKLTQGESDAYFEPLTLNTPLPAVSLLAFWFLPGISRFSLFVRRGNACGPPAAVMSMFYSPTTGSCC